MTRFKAMLFGVVAGLAACGLAIAGGEDASKAVKPDRMAWWREARFGMLICWDMSSVAGTEMSWSRGATRPLDVTRQPAGYVEDPMYDNLYKKFNPVKFDAKEWVGQAKAAGVKYIVFTAKHHAGFCMWDTKLTDYSIMSTPFKRDVVRELAGACHKAGMPFGLYYSQRDWHHPDYGVGDNAKYHEYMKGQLTELLTNYGTIDVIWFDSFGHGDSIKYWHADEILALVRRLQPNIIVNDRCKFFWENVEALKGDFDTPEERIGTFQNHRPWESCMCMVTASNGGWSYRKDGKVKPFGHCLQILLGCATGDGNLLLSVGPDPTGVIPDDQAGVLGEMGAWMKKYGDSIYGTRGGPFRNGGWGGSTCRGKTVYLHVARWNSDKLKLPPLKARVVQCSLMGNKEARPALEQTDHSIVVSVPKDLQEQTDTVIVLQLDSPAEAEMKDGKPLDVK